MPDVKIVYQITIQLRRFPMIHRPLKWLRRTALKEIINGMIELVRRLAPLNSRWGPAKGTFSLMELVRAKSIPGRIILEDQGNQKLPNDSLQVLCGLQQHAEQPRAIFWSQ